MRHDWGTAMHARLTILAAGAAALAFLAAPAAAEQSFDVAARALGDNTSTVHRVGDEHVLVWSLTEFDTLEADDPESPMAGLAGPCFGQLEIVGDDASGGGYCTWTDGDGDSYVARWSASAVGAEGESAPASLSASATEGEWTVVGGTGKWEGASGGGSFRDHEDIETGRRVRELRGQVTLR
jgi:hypothetical protein